MFKGYRDGKFAIGLIVGLSIATLCFYWVFSVNYCPDAPCRYQKPPDQSETYNQRWFPIPWNPNSTLQTKPPIAEGAPNDQEYYDLVAQENMARATNVIAWATIAGVGISAIGIWLLISNLSAVGEANQIMRDEQRPWVKVAVELKKSMFITESGRAILFCECKLLAENVGKTPAKNLHLGLYRVENQNGIADLADNHGSIVSSLHSAGTRVLLPGDETTVGCTLRFPICGVEFSASRMTQNRGNGSVPYWVCIAEYDVGSERKHTAVFGVLEAGNGRTAWRQSSGVEFDQYLKFVDVDLVTSVN